MRALCCCWAGSLGRSVAQGAASAVWGKGETLLPGLHGVVSKKLFAVTIPANSAAGEFRIGGPRDCPLPAPQVPKLQGLAGNTESHNFAQ